LNIVAGQNGVGEEGSKNAEGSEEEHHLVLVNDWWPEQDVGDKFECCREDRGAMWTLYVSEIESLPS
jgi:hypothetical protein